MNMTKEKRQSFKGKTLISTNTCQQHVFYHESFNFSTRIQLIRLIKNVLQKCEI